MFINLTPHSVQVYSPSQFAGLEQVNPTTQIADEVTGEPILDLPSSGSARISTKTEDSGFMDGVAMYKTAYGEAQGIPEDLPDDALLVVSLPMQSMAKQSGHPLADRMVAPYGVVRSRANGSIVLGCQGFTY